VRSSTVVLSAEQREAILTPGNLLVRAGAGSGKTEVLARRFVALIAGEIEGHQPLNAAQVAAITFTDKAAYDMRARIASVLEERILSPAQGEGRSYLIRARAMLPLARISTIHAFCARLLRENALDAALDPDFEVLDDYESQTFLERLCKQVLIDAVRQSEPGAWYLARARGLDPGTPREGALAIVMRILDEVARLGRTPQWLYDATCEAAARIQAEEGRVAVLAGELSRLLDELLAAGSLSALAEQTIAPLRIRRQEYQERILAINAHVEPEALDFLHEFCEFIPSARGRVRDCVASIKNIANRAGNGRFGLGGELISAYGAYRAIPRALEIAAMIRDLALKLEAAKADERVVTFDDLLFRTNDLLERSASTRLRYRALIRALLVDEFQDTDAIQHEIVARLVDPETEVEAPELFLVGDEKQSIYRFRGADVAGFGRIRERLGASPIRELPLLGNRRSSPNIVAFVNGIGASLMHAREQPPPPYWVEWSSEHELSALRTPALDPAVEIITAIPDSPIDSAAFASRRVMESAPPTVSARRLNAGRKRMLEGSAIASRINQLVGNEMVTDSATSELRPVRYSDIVLLLRAFTDVAIYEGALLDAGVPCYTVKGRGFFACQEVLDFIELLTTIDDPADSMALAAALRSPFFAVSDDCLAEIALHSERVEASVEFSPASPFCVTFADSGPDFSWLSAGRDDAIRAWRILGELRRLRQRGTIAGVVEHALEATGYEAVMLGLRQGPQRVANLRKLADLARDFESRRLFTFHDFVVHLRRLGEQQPYEPPAQILGENENVVRLMTVHQAKGLEFPVVFLADAGRRPDSDTRNPVADPENGLLLCDAVGSGMDEIPNDMLDKFRKRSNGEQQAESLRLLYVALTRARDRLIVSEGAMLQGWAKQIRNFLGDEILGAFVSSRKEREFMERAGAKIVLMLPEYARRLPEIASAVDPQANDHELAALTQRRLNFEPPGSCELVISPTALADFDRCPRQFHFRHGLKLPEPASEDGATASARASAMGTVAHAALERVQSNPTNEHKIGELVDLFGIPAGLDTKERAIIIADLARYLAKFVTSAATAREVPFFYNIGESLFVRGQIDALIEQGDRVIIRDYKYARGAGQVSLYQVQMEAYALAVADAYPRSSVEAEIVFLKDDSVAVPVTLRPLPDMRARVLTLGRAIVDAQTSRDYPKKPPSASVCHKLRCGFVELCWSD